MKRKLIKQGLGGHTIYLPKKWVDEYKLKTGDEVDIDLVDSKIVISAEGIKEKKETKINITKKNEFFLYPLLAQNYRMGYDRIVIEVYSPQVLPKIEDHVNKFLLGFGIVEKTKNGCIIESVTEPSEEKFSVLLRRNFLIIKETCQIILEDIQNGSYPNFKEVEEHKIQQDKYVFFCRRIISKRLLAEKNPMLSWEMLAFLMAIEHGQYRLYDYLRKQKKFRANKKTIDLYKYAISRFNLFYEAYFEKNFEKVVEANVPREDVMFRKSYTVLQEAKGPEVVIVYHAREFLKLLDCATASVMSGLVLEMKI